MILERAYTDTEIRADYDDLEMIARDYLESYAGEFAPLVLAQQALPSLSLPTIRMTLNCMRHDLNVILPDRPRLTRDYRKAAKPIVEKRRQPSRVTLGGQWFNGTHSGCKIRLRGDFLANHHRQAKWFHQIDHSRTVGFYYPHDWWEVDKRHSVEVWIVKALCGKDFNVRSGGKDLELTQTAEEAGGVNLHCKRCQELAQ